MKPMRKKIGYISYNNHKFSVWLDNSIVLQLITISIYDDESIPPYIITGLNFNRKLDSRKTNIVTYAILDLERIKDKLKEISEYLKTNIDYNKVDEFLFKIEKQLIVKRLE